MEATETSSEDSKGSTVRSPRRRFQIGISTALLLIAAASSWLGFEVLRRETQKLQSYLPGLRSAARELQVINEDQISVVHRHQEWNDENIWDIYLPPTGEFKVCLATEDVNRQGTPASFESVNLKPGRRKIELIQEKFDDGRVMLQMLVDDRTEIEVEKPKGWYQQFGFSGGSRISENAEYDAQDPVILLQMRFMVDTGNGGSKSPQGPANGILVWVEPVNQ